MRIVSLLPSATELLLAIGAGDMVVAVTHECDYPAAATALPRITSNALDNDGASPADIDRHIRRALHSGSSIYHLNEPMLQNLKPDLIVTQELCEVCAVLYGHVEQAVRALPGDVPVISLEPGSLDDIIATALVLGEATGRREGAGALAASLRRRFLSSDGGAVARWADRRRDDRRCGRSQGRARRKPAVDRPTHKPERSAACGVFSLGRPTLTHG